MARSLMVSVTLAHVVNSPRAFTHSLFFVKCLCPDNQLLMMKARSLNTAAEEDNGIHLL